MVSKQYFKLMLISIAILMSYNLLLGIGYFKPDIDYSFFRGLTPAVYLIIYLCILSKCKIFNSRGNNFFLFIISLLVFFNLSTGRNVDVTMIMSGFISPILIYQFFQNYNFDFYITRARRFLILFYVIECCLAIFERFIGKNLLVDVGEMYGDFRSYSLIGHPLQNALCVSIMMSFILFSNLKYKFELFFLGMIAIMCFNTRSTMAFWGGTSIIYWFYLVATKNKQYKRYTCYIIIAVIFFAYLMIQYGLGNRLLEMGLYDEDSAGVRIRIFDIFNYYSINDFILGMPSYEIERILFRSGIDGLIIENYWLMFVLRFGILFTIALFICILSFLMKMTVDRPPFERWFIILAFLLISSTNNSISIPNNGILSCFTLCYFSFQQKKFIHNAE